MSSNSFKDHITKNMLNFKGFIFFEDLPELYNDFKCYYYSHLLDICNEKLDEDMAKLFTAIRINKLRFNCQYSDEIETFLKKIDNKLK